MYECINVCSPGVVQVLIVCSRGTRVSNLRTIVFSTKMPFRSSKLHGPGHYHYYIYIYIYIYIYVYIEILTAGRSRARRIACPSPPGLKESKSFRMASTMSMPPVLCDGYLRLVLVCFVPALLSLLL